MATVSNSFMWKCTPEIWEKAMLKARLRIKTEYKRDIRLDEQERIEKIAIGYIGEFAFQAWCELNDLPVEYLGEEIGYKPDEGDFISILNVVIDVKTQEVFYFPHDDWRCEVTLEQINRPADVYIFSKLFTKRSNKELYIVGWMTKKEFKSIAIFRPMGTLLKGKPVHYPKYDILIEQLHELENLKSVIKKIHDTENIKL